MHEGLQVGHISYARLLNSNQLTNQELNRGHALNVTKTLVYYRFY